MKDIAGQTLKDFPSRHTLAWVFYLPTIFTGAKSFKKNPVIGNRLLNRFGLHVLRVVIAAGFFRLRRLLLMWMLSGADRHALARDGYLIKQDFLPPTLFEQLQKEARNSRLEARACFQGNAITHRVLLDHATRQQLPACDTLLNLPAWRRTLAYASGRFRIPGVWIQRIYNGVNQGRPDPQLTLHSDTFHPTIKAWLFLDDVDDNNGPFSYVPGSHRLTWRRLAWEYRRSLTVLDDADHYSASGSLRLDDQEIEYLSLPPPVACRVPRNSLVIADTHGFHCRGASKPGSMRLAIWCISRTNPFNPLPGLPLQLLDRIDLALFRSHLAWQDRRAAVNGGQPSWRRVDPAWRPPAG